MRYFLENFEKVYNKDWPFGYFPAWQYYASTGTHIGTDFKVPVGTPVFAPMDGEMFKTESNRYKGNVGIFIFKHNDVEWGLELCHLREQPQRGPRKEGDIIAYSGMTGEKVDGAHLHAVLHRNAAVSRHYQILKNREAFLGLEKEGAIVDCFSWFCAVLQEKVTEKLWEKIALEKEGPPLVPQVETDKKTESRSLMTLLETLLELFRSFFGK